MDLPLQPGCRVECLFEGEEGYFDGVIAWDNGDGTYRVEFDDGDIEERAPRSDIRVIPQGEAEADVSNLPQDETLVHGSGVPVDHNSTHSAENFGEGQESHNHPTDGGNDLPPPASGTEPQEQLQRQDSHVAQHLQQESVIIRDDAEKEDRRPQESYDGGDDGHQEGDASAGNKGDAVATSRRRDHEPRSKGDPTGLTTGSGESETEHGGLDVPHTRHSHRIPSAERPSPPSAFAPTATNPLHEHLEALAVAAPRLLGEAPPDFRLSAVACRIAALEKQLRQQEARGEAWNIPVFTAGTTLSAGGRPHAGYPEHPAQAFPETDDGEVSGSPRATTASGRAAGPAAPSFPAHAELRKVALVRLCYGDVSLEMVQAIADLAEGYAKESLWPQVSNHMARATNILARDQDGRPANNGGLVTASAAWANIGATPQMIRASPSEDPAGARGGVPDGAGRGLVFSTQDRYSDPSWCSSMSPGRCAHLLLELFCGLRAATGAGNHNRGQVARQDLAAFLSTHKDKKLRSAAAGFTSGAHMPNVCGWGKALGCLRRHSGLFTDLNLKVMEGVKLKQAAQVRLAFQEVDPESTGCADAELLLGELHASFSRNDGNFLEALHPGLLSALADIVEATPKDGEPKDEPGTSSRRVELNSPPITWEEVLALMVVEDEGEVDGDARAGKTRQIWRSLLGVRVKLLTGRCQTHTNNLTAACRNLSEALAELKRLGLGEASGSVPVLNGLTDALALTHRRNLERSSVKAKKLAEAWIQGKEGQDLWKQECKRLLLECRRRLEVVPRTEVEERTWQALVAYRAKTLVRELGVQGKELDAAEDFLVRAWEILESRHGRAHPDVGAACLSLGNLAIIRRSQDEAVDWFRRALGTFEVLSEATGLLEKGARFYSDRVEKAVRIPSEKSALNPELLRSARGGFAWTDPDVAGSRLDRQTADFAWRAAELWTQVASLRESGGRGGSHGDTDTGHLSMALQKEEGDHNGARDAFSQARAIFTDRFGRSDPRAKGAAAAAAVAAQRTTAPPSPAAGRAFNARQEVAR
eukprot:g11265.t1